MFSKEARAIMAFMLKNLSDLCHFPKMVAEGCYDAAVNHYGYQVAPEGREFVVEAAMSALQEIYDRRDELDCEEEVT